ncbi:MAG: hypothetical protein HPY50_15080 [Firmicutes bacterium]|nr:hypothetical protein [Bacillota bacterium]
MAVLAGFLVLFGMAGAVVALVMMIVQFVFKRGWAKKRIWTVGAISLALFAVGMVMGVSSVPDGYEAGQQAARSEKAASTSPASPPTPSVEPVNDNQTASEPPTTDKASVGKQKDEESGLISGILAADIKLNLEKSWKLKFTGPRPVPGSKEYLDDGKVTDPDTGVQLSCTITEDTATKVKYATFRADGTGVAGLLPAEIYLAVAKGFLGFSSTLPYDGSDPAKAKEWVEKNISKANQPGKPITTTIGQVEFTLAGGKYIRLLSLKPVRSSE